MDKKTAESLKAPAVTGFPRFPQISNFGSTLHLPSSPDFPFLI
jgi:hypothetical protein